MAGRTRGTLKPPKPSLKRPPNPPTPRPDSDPNDELRKAFGERAFALLPDLLLNVRTRTFAYHDDMPESNPKLTVWAFMNALKGSTIKGQESVNVLENPRLLEIRMKKDIKKLTETPYTMNFKSSQNCDTMLRHLYGVERPTTEACVKSRGHKRKATSDNDDNNSESDDTDPFSRLDLKTCLALKKIFSKATKRKKEKRSKHS
ncbi:hypothetical protein QQZ08_007246 [Neonectria magnoliae]|uniref:Uncharacterized protein n=1 Tax=Neonectria magnoliae TaxID=2732573 RepID=A0ABR1HZT1_9HYPO